MYLWHKRPQDSYRRNNTLNSRTFKSFQLDFLIALKLWKYFTNMSKVILKKGNYYKTTRQCQEGVILWLNTDYAEPTSTDKLNCVKKTPLV